MTPTSRDQGTLVELAARVEEALRQKRDQPDLIAAVLDRALEQRGIEHLLDVAEALADLGEAYSRAGRTDEALAAHDRAVAAGWDCVPDARMDRARYLIRGGRLEEGRAVHDEIAAQFPGDVWCYNAAGLNEVEAGDPERAADWFGRGIELVLERGDDERVLPQLLDLREKSLAAAGREPDALQRRGEALFETELRRLEEAPPTPHRPLPASATIPEILEELRLNRGYFPRGAVEAAIARREEIVPELLRVLDDAIARPEELLADSDAMGHIYALYLLAQFREPAAYSRVVRYFSLPGELAVDATGDVATEDLDRILASLHRGDLRPILELATTATASEWARGAAVRALAESVFSDQLSRDEAVSLLTPLFRGAIERRPSNAWNCLVSVALDLHATELTADIRRAFAHGLIDPFFVGSNVAERTLKEPREVVLKGSRLRARGLIVDVVRDTSWWACFLQESRQRQGLVQGPQPIRTEPKVGRNAPCSCGSGRKYKKCCGRPGATSTS
jgi:tetratricopeptide (TPR) repeat protein